MRRHAPEALLLDLDGTLVHSRDEVNAAWRAFAARHGLPPARVLAASFAGPSREVVAAVAPWLDLDAEAARVERWQVNAAGRTRAAAGAAELLAAWPAGRLAVVTSCGRALAQARLAGAGLPEPAVLVSADDVRRGKPDPEGYLRAAALLGVAPERCVAVEDAPAGIAAARAAGAATVAVATTHDARDLGAADRVIASLAELSLAPRRGGGRARDNLVAVSTAATTPLRTVRATRYAAPLREGGSLPALVEADDDGMYVVKMRGAGQGPKALVAELIAGELARRAGPAVPEIAFVELDAALAPAEPDQEIQDLLKASIGLNLGLDFLPGALAFDPAAPPEVDPALAASVVWLDALLTNVDRTARNPNLLEWHGRLWLIDHGAALYLHHRTWHLAPRARDPFPAIAEHVLLPFACSIDEVNGAMADALGGGAVDEVVALVPDAWLAGGGEGAGPAERRRAYADYLARRLERPRAFAAEAERARRG